MSYRFMPQALILSVVLAAAGLVRGSTVEKLSFDRLIDEADVIVKGRVEEVKTRPASDRRFVTTVVTVSVVSQFKGAEVSSITIDQPGGSMGDVVQGVPGLRSEEHTSELQSQSNLVCRLLLEKKKKKNNNIQATCKQKKIYKN